jgi:hypothetical protein
MGGANMGNLVMEPFKTFLFRIKSSFLMIEGLKILLAVGGIQWQ